MNYCTDFGFLIVLLVCLCGKYVESSPTEVNSELSSATPELNHKNVKRDFSFGGLPNLSKLLSSLVSLFPPELEQELRRRGFKLLLDNNKTNPEDGVKSPLKIVNDKPEQEPHLPSEAKHMELEPMDMSEKNSVPYSMEGDDSFENSQESLENDYPLPPAGTRSQKSTTPAPAPDVDLDVDSHENLMESKLDELRASLAKMHQDRQHDIDQLIDQRQQAQNDLLNRGPQGYLETFGNPDPDSQGQNRLVDAIRQRQNELIDTLRQRQEDFGEAIRQRQQDLQQRINQRQHELAESIQQRQQEHQQVLNDLIRQSIKGQESGRLPILLPPNSVISVGRMGSPRGQSQGQGQGQGQSGRFYAPQSSLFSQMPQEPTQRPIKRVHVNLIHPLQLPSPLSTSSVHNNPEEEENSSEQNPFNPVQLPRVQFQQVRPNLPRTIPVRVTRIQHVVLRKFMPKPNEPSTQHPSISSPNSHESESSSGHHHRHRPHKHHHHHGKPGVDIRTKETHIRLNPHSSKGKSRSSGKPFTVFLDENPGKAKTVSPTNSNANADSHLPFPNLSSLFDILRFLEQNESPVHVFPSSLKQQPVASVSMSKSLPPIILSGSGVKVMGIPFDIVNNKLVKRDTKKAV